ncbi:MAG: putative oxidoreductase C-terminal domain-containing protein [Bryobacteraceae bacterium]|nr:putative oxidoreductase C-terminal domain-containing protein [Bryobacteraceae bacterium]
MRLAVALLAASVAARADDLTLVTLDPAHSHAAQLYAAPLKGFAPDTWIYAPVGRDLANFWIFVSSFIQRSPAPAHWRFTGYTGADFLERLLADKRGNVLSISGRNARKLEYLEAGIRAGMHVLADKPWIIEAEQLPRLIAALDEAERRRVVVYDCMTQRFDLAYQLQRELVNDRDLFGVPQQGSASKPAVRMVSSHFLLKSGFRPAWYFDIKQQGEALADVGTHVVDLAHWTLFPDQALDYRKDIQLLKARRWPTILTEEQYRKVTDEPRFPAYLKDKVIGGKLHYYTNNSLLYTARGIHIALDVMWEYQSPIGDRDSMLAVYTGTKSEIAVRAGKEQSYIPEVDVTPVSARPALERRLKALAARWPGLTVREADNRLHIVIPETLRVTTDHFLLLAERFAGFIRKTEPLPAWEKPAMAAKYYVTTHGVKLAREQDKP